MLSTDERDIDTYNLGFFLGPGLLRSLGRANGSIEGGARLRPAMAPPFFFFPSPSGGANELFSLASVPVAGTGVALESLASSSVTCIDGDGSGLTDDFGTSTSALSEGN
jgi:hypothetical protein